MKAGAITAFLTVLAFGLPVWGGSPGEPLTPTNVNARYIIESVNVSGWDSRAISTALRTQIHQVVGDNLDPAKLNTLADRIKGELKAARVKIQITKGTIPDHVLVNFEVAKKRVDLKMAKFLYDSHQGWSGEGSMTTRGGANAFTVGLASDGDELLERYAGIRLRYDREHVGTDRLAFDFSFDDFHEMWNHATASQDPADIYRSRQVFRPEARVILMTPLELDFGLEFARFRLSTPAPATTESSNAVVSTLRYHQRWGSGEDVQDQALEASYSLQAALPTFGSDARFTRHQVQAHYHFRHDRSRVDVAFMAGRILGLAPLFDRFVLGNAALLRGWNKFQIDPEGGSHVVYGSTAYTYRFYQVFYDTGAVWDRGQDREPRQSVGAGFKKEGFQLAVAFPLCTGRANPVFFAGMNF